MHSEIVLQNVKTSVNASPINNNLACVADVITLLGDTASALAIVLLYQ